MNSPINWKAGFTGAGTLLIGLAIVRFGIIHQPIGLVGAFFSAFAIIPYFFHRKAGLLFSTILIMQLYYALWYSSAIDSELKFAEFWYLHDLLILTTLVACWILLSIKREYSTGVATFVAAIQLLMYGVIFSILQSTDITFYGTAIVLAAPFNAFHVPAYLPPSLFISFLWAIIYLMRRFRTRRIPNTTPITYYNK